MLASAGAFVVLEGTAMRLYPGGTWWDPTTAGYRFWQNYLCDLEWHVGLDGRDNTAGSHLAKAAMLALLVGLSCFWLIVPRLFGESDRRDASQDARTAEEKPGSASPSPRAPASWRSLSNVVPAMGLASVAGTVAVALMPSDAFPVLHGFFVIASGVPGLAAAALTVRGLRAPGSLWPFGGRLGAALFVVALLDLGLYAFHWASGDDATLLLPAIQKIGLFLLLVWMNGVALRGLRLARRVS